MMNRNHKISLRLQIEKGQILFWLSFVMFLSGFTINTFGQYNALTWRMNTAYNNYLLREVHQQYADRESEFSTALQSKAAMLLYRDNCIQRYKNIIGEFPPKGNLNAKVLGSTQQDGFHIEKIVFESTPNRFVTANLYLPEGNGPFPVALELCGHGLGGKIPASRSAILFALNGIATMVVDPVGQGERIQFLDENNRSLTRGATTEHTLLNMGANLVGTSVAAIEYWDNHCAIDYLESRSDIDKTKIGVYGSSGGGTQTAYLIGLDARVKVASICSYFTKREKVLEIYGPSDGCQHIPYEGREHLEIADFVLMMAPKPVLIMSGKYDFVDYYAATKAYGELKQAYTALESPEKVSQFSCECGHGMPQAKREALVTWFRQWLINDNTPIKETKLVNIPIDDLRCTATGQVLTSAQENISLPNYFLNLAEQSAKKRKEFLKNDQTVITKKVKELLGLSYSNEKINAEISGTYKGRNYDATKYQIIRLGEMPVPLVVIYPENANSKSEVKIMLHDEGKEAILTNETTLEPFINDNTILIVADLRGFGETTDPLQFNDAKYWNKEYRNAMTSMHIGKPIMGQRVTDILSIVDFIESVPQLHDHPISVSANGLYGPTVIHAVYLDNRIDKAEISGSVKSYIGYLKNPLQRDIYTNVLYGVLNYYDLTDLISLSDKRVRYTD